MTQTARHSTPHGAAARKPTAKPIGRPREFDEDEVVGRMRDLFWDQGFEATSITDIERVTGLHKGSLYAAFGSKQNMYLRGLAAYEADSVDAACDGMDAAMRAGGNAAEMLSALMNAPIASFSSGDFRGCFLCNASAERASSDRETQVLVTRAYSRMQTTFALAVSRIRPGWNRAQIDARASLLLVTYSGLRVMARAKVSRELLEAARDASLEF